MKVGEKKLTKRESNKEEKEINGRREDSGFEPDY